MSTEINALAEQLLFGQQLEDKLQRPETLKDESPKGISAAPTLPGRPAGAAWNRKRSPFPKESQLDNDFQRGRALLFFANHELLAIELMALCLLRFPDAPSHFRRGLLNTIFEEQITFDFTTIERLRLGSRSKAWASIDFSGIVCPICRIHLILSSDGHDL